MVKVLLVTVNDEPAGCPVLSAVMLLTEPSLLKLMVPVSGTVEDGENGLRPSTRVYMVHSLVPVLR
ncbi:hypothetical protein D3C71_2215090 [compost metagenome]